MDGLANQVNDRFSKPVDGNGCHFYACVIWICSDCLSHLASLMVLFPKVPGESTLPWLRNSVFVHEKVADITEK